jgi:hypothetical protein
VNTPLDVAPRPSSHPQPLLPEDELSLAALLELLTAEEVPAPSARHALRSSGTRLLVWWQDSSRRAAQWGAVPAAPSDASGDRSARSAVPAVR